MKDVPVVLFLCTHNAGRSLAARVLLDHYAGGRIDVRSAGSEPADDLNASVVALLVERGLDPAGEFPKAITDESAGEDRRYCHDGLWRCLSGVSRPTLCGLGPR